MKQENQFTDNEETTYNVSLNPQKKEQYQLQEIASERVTEEIEDDIAALRNKLNQTPLSFYVKIGQSYLFSFRRENLMGHLGKTLLLALFEISVGAFVYEVLKISQPLKNAMIALIFLNITLFLLLFLIDPGTLFEDEEEKLDIDRYFCQPCRLYRYDSTHHCRYCIKCVKGYDHHCSFFGKCIGQRNYIMFALFLLSMAAGGMLSMGGLVYSLFVGLEF